MEFVIYYVAIGATGVLLHAFVSKRLTGQSANDINLSVKQSIQLKLSAALIYTVAALIILKISNVGFIDLLYLKERAGLGLLLIFILVPVILFVCNSLAKSEKHNINYPKIKIEGRQKELLLLNAVLWSLYLFSYELFFRGAFLFACIELAGIILSIVFNVVLYFVAHLHKGKLESLGSIPFGIVFCIIAYLSDSFMVVFVLHLVLAVSNDFFCMHYKSKL